MVIIPNEQLHDAILSDAMGTALWPFVQLALPGTIEARCDRGFSNE